jgi:hypothetical protein
MGLERIISPFKMLAMCFHLVSIISSFFTYSENILANDAGITAASQSPEEARVLVANIIALILLGLEALLVLQGLTLWQHGPSLACTLLHFLGCILWSAFSYWAWAPLYIWVLLAFTSAPCLLLEVGGAVRTSLRVKRSQ